VEGPLKKNGAKDLEEIEPDGAETWIHRKKKVESLSDIYCWRASGEQVPGGTKIGKEKRGERRDFPEKRNPQATCLMQEQ